MIRESEQFAQTDRQRRERIDKRNRAEALALQGERQLKEVALEFGMQFASSQRRKIEALIQELRDSIARDDDRRIDRAQSDLQDALYELNREVRLLSSEDEDDFFGSIRRTFTGESDPVVRDYEQPYSGRIRNTSNDSDDYRAGSVGSGRSRPENRGYTTRSTRTTRMEDDWDDDDDDWL
jgi:molecular chaperone DnaK